MAVNTAISIGKVMIGTITAEPIGLPLGLEVTGEGRIHLVGPHHHLQRE
jgi:hypothetical protein